MLNFNNSTRRELEFMVSNLQVTTNNLLDSVNQIYLDPFYFHVRLYYDDFCLAEVRTDNSCDCRDTMYVYKPKFEVGKTYSLRNINFDLDKHVLLPQSYVELDNLFNILREYPKMVIKIMGHTDNQNSDAYNITLSNNRALACVKYLTKKGININRLTWQGYGERIPLTTNDTEAGRAANRRVEFLVLKVD
jgi:outer membrane protein OmpA-like peptidoglycan-associated protein